MNEQDSTLKLPSFLVIGEQKCGTGWIRDRLREHPDVFMADKEIKFFSHKANYAKGLPHYARVFASATQEVVGEKSPEYFWQNSGQDALHDDIFGLIDQTLPEARITLVLRDPIARAVSALQHHVEHRGRRIHPTVVKTQSVEDILFSGRYDLDHLGILQRSYYAERLQEAMSVFGDRLKVLIFERDIVDDPKGGLDAICDHIGAPRWDEFNYKQNDKAGKPSYPVMWMSYYAPVLRPVFRAVDVWQPLKVKATPALRERMTEMYRADVERVETLLNSPLIGKWWMK